jgi:hypothetical protein
MLRAPPDGRRRLVRWTRHWGDLLPLAAFLCGAGPTIRGVNFKCKAITWRRRAPLETRAPRRSRTSAKSFRQRLFQPLVTQRLRRCTRQGMVPADEPGLIARRRCPPRIRSTQRPGMKGGTGQTTPRAHRSASHLLLSHRGKCIRRRTDMFFGRSGQAQALRSAARDISLIMRDNATWCHACQKSWGVMRF